MLQLFSHKDCQFYKVQFKTAEENKGGKSYKLSVVVTETPTLAQCFQYFFAIISVSVFFLLEHRFVIIITDQSKHKAIG